MNGTLGDVIFGNGANGGVKENETLEQQTGGQHNGSERFADRASQNVVMENNIEDKVKRAIVNAVFTAGNRMHDTILTAKEKVVIHIVEMAVKSITGSSRHEPSSEVPHPDF